MPMELGLHSELEARGANLYFIVQGTLRSAPIDAPAGVVPSAPLAKGLDGHALTSAPDGTLFYSKRVVVPVPNGGQETFRTFRLAPGGTEEELVTNEEGIIGDVAWHDGQLYVVSLLRRTIRAVDLAASPHTARAIGACDASPVYGITTDASGRIYYVDSRQAFRFDPATGQNELLASTGLLLAESVALGRGPLDATDVYVAAMPNALLRHAAGH
jgi:hypothetical protein